MRFAYRIFGLLTFAASGCGVSQELYLARVNELDRAQAELSRSKTQLQAVRSKNEELTQESIGLRDRIITLETERFKLASNLRATEKEMDELRRAHAMAEQRGELYRTLVSKLRGMID